MTRERVDRLRNAKVSCMRPVKGFNQRRKFEGIPRVDNLSKRWLCKTRSNDLKNIRRWRRLFCYLLFIYLFVCCLLQDKMSGVNLAN